MAAPLGLSWPFIQPKSLKALLASSDNPLGIVFIPDGPGVDVAGKVRFDFSLAGFVLRVAGSMLTIRNDFD